MIDDTRLREWQDLCDKPTSITHGANFIATVRTALPQAIAEIKELREALLDCEEAVSNGEPGDVWRIINRCGLKPREVL